MEEVVIDEQLKNRSLFADNFNKCADKGGKGEKNSIWPKPANCKTHVAQFNAGY